MKFPKAMHIKVDDKNTIIVKLKNQIFDETRGIFEVTFEISKEFIKADFKNDNFRIITEER